MTDDKPHVFNNRVHRSLAAAETVLGPQAVKGIIATVLTDFSELPITVDDCVKKLLEKVFNLIDPKKQTVFKTHDDGTFTIRLEPLDDVTKKVDGYTLIDLQTAIAVAINDNLTGFVLEVLQTKWNRELTLDDADNINFHLNQLLKILNEKTND